MDDLDKYFAMFQIETSEQKCEKPNSHNLCYNCNGDNLLVDQNMGTIVCRDCGTVTEDTMIDDNPEWNFGLEEAMNGKDPSRCGCPINPLLEKSSMSTLIGKGGGSKFWLLRKIHQQNSMDYVERSRWHVFEFLSKVGEGNNLPPIVINQAKQFYKDLSEKKLSRGGVRKGLIACCILFACKQCNVSRSVKEIAAMCDTDTAKINNATKIFQEVMNVSTTSKESTKSNDLISRFTSCINCSKKNQQLLIKQAEKLNSKIEESGILVGKTPSAITSAMIYFLLTKNNISVNKKALANQHNISVVTLNKIVNIIETHSDLLGIDEM